MLARPSQMSYDRGCTYFRWLRRLRRAIERTGPCGGTHSISAVLTPAAFQGCQSPLSGLPVIPWAASHIHRELLSPGISPLSHETELRGMCRT